MAKTNKYVSGLLPAVIAAAAVGILITPVAGLLAGIGMLVLLANIENKHKPANPGSGQKPEKSGVTVTLTTGGSSRRIDIDEDEGYAIGGEREAKAGSYTYIPKGESTKVAGISLGGMIYTGKVGRGNYHEPAVIDPSLKTSDRGLPDPLGYWPNYSELSPRQRHEYLTWLGGQRGYTDQLGYVFIYFYGFERYVLVDAKNDQDGVRRQNARDIYQEVVRLQTLFPDSNSFRNYAQQLLDLIAILHLPDKMDERSKELPLSNALAVQHAIITHANTNREEPLSADWALQWVITCGSAGRTRAVRDNYATLRVLFRAKYEAETKGGLVLPKCKTRARLHATPAARGLDRNASIPYPSDWFDPTQLKRPLNKLEQIFREVMPAVRKLAKALQSKDPVLVLSSWPVGLPLSSAPKLKQFADKLDAFLTKHPSPPLSTVAGLFKIEIKDKATAKQMKDLAAALSVIDRVMVPDPLLKSVSLKPDDVIVTYPGKRVEELSPEGERLSTTIHLGTMLALSDGDLHEREEATLSKVVSSHSNSTEREYLSHYLSWRLKQAPSATGLKKQIDKLGEKDKSELAAVLIDVARADGALPTAEIKELDKLFRRLGLDTSSVASMLHASAVEAPVASAPASRKSSSAPIGDGSSAKVSIDAGALEAHKQATEEVQSVLSTIFSDEDIEEPELAASDSVPEQADVWHEGHLDEAHSTLADWLLTADEWPMGQIEAKCAELGLMAEGALTQINEAAFETLGDSLVEFGDPVEVYRDVMPPCYPSPT